MKGIRYKARPARRRLTSVLALLLAVGAGAPAVSQAGVLTYGGGVLTYTGGAEENSVTAVHPGANSEQPAGPDNPPVMGKLLIRENAGEAEIKISPSASSVCKPDDFFGVQCDVPTRFVLNLAGNNDAIQIGTDDVPVAVEIHADGGPGMDVFDGSSGRNVFRGGPENDELRGHGGADLLSGDDGDDTLEGGDGNDELNGFLGADRLTGGAGNDVVRGGDGDDQLDYSPLYAFDGSDTLAGGPGRDYFGYFGRTAAISVNLDNLPNDGQGGENDNVGLDIEEVDGSDVGDVMIGSSGPNGLAGRGGDDRISGGGGNDVLYGDSNNDLIDGGDGDDTLDGGCHDDRIIGGRGIDSLNSDGTCENPSLRGLNDVLEARDGFRDALILCTVSGTPGDTAIVDPVDPALGPGNPGACRTIDRGAAAGGGGGTTSPGGGGGTTSPGGGGGTPGTTAPTVVTLQGTVRAILGPALRLLTGTGRPGQAAPQSVNLRTKRLTLGSLVATSTSRVKAVASFRVRGRTLALGKATLTVEPGTPRMLSIGLPRKALSALRRVKRASIQVRFTAVDPARNRVVGRTTKTFRVRVKR